MNLVNKVKSIRDSIVDAQIRFAAKCASTTPVSTKSQKRAEVFTSFMFMLGLVLLGAHNAFAITAPAAGDFAYDIYDVAVNKVLLGPIGVVGGVAAVVMGAASAIQQRIMLAIPSVLGGVMLLKANDIVTSLGMTF